MRTWADARQLTSDQNRIGNIALSPDGQDLAFDLVRDGGRYISILGIDGGDPRRLTPDPMNHLFPRWSPDGKRIAFHSEDGAGEGDIWVAPIAGGPLVQLTRAPGWDIVPAWSPDGQKIAFSSFRDGNWDVRAVRIASGEEKQLTKHKGFDRVCCQNGVWSPDGREIAIYSDRSGSMDVWIVSIEDGKERRVTTEPGQERNPAWSPDGEWILYLSAGEHLARVRPTGGRPEPLPEGSRNGRWSRDGKKIYFNLTRNGFENVYEISVDGGPERQLTDLKGKQGSLGLASTDDRNLYFRWVEEIGDIWVMDVKR